MTKVQRFVLAVLFAAIVASASAGAQSGSEVSVGALSSGAALQGGQPGVVTTAKKTGNKRSMIASAPGALRLCFQPGIGWQSVPVSTVGGAGNTPESASSVGTGVNQSTPKGTAKSAYAQPSGAKEAISSECPGTWTNAIAPSLTIEDVITGEHAPAMASARATNMNAGALDWLQTNSALNRASSAASQRLIMGLGPVPGYGVHSSAGGRSGVSTDQANSLKTHAYVSPIKLRGMMWNAPDLQTRIKLHRQLEILAKKSTRPSDHPRKGRSMKEYEMGSMRTTVHRSYSEKQSDRMSRP